MQLICLADLLRPGCYFDTVWVWSISWTQGLFAKTQWDSTVRRVLHFSDWPCWSRCYHRLIIFYKNRTSDWISLKVKLTTHQPVTVNCYLSARFSLSAETGKRLLDCFLIKQIILCNTRSSFLWVLVRKLAQRLIQMWSEHVHLSLSADSQPEALLTQPSRLKLMSDLSHSSRECVWQRHHLIMRRKAICD